MNAILIATLVIAAVGAVAALALAIADKYLAVQEDPRIGLVTAALPGANCGGCGFPGCDGYARALVAGTAPNGACAAGGEACSAEIMKTHIKLSPSIPLPCCVVVFWITAFRTDIFRTLCCWPVSVP